MTGMSSLFKSYNISSGKDRVCIADGTYSSIARHGDILATFLLLYSGLHVLNSILNLLSISHFTKIFNCSVIFINFIVCFKT